MKFGRIRGSVASLLLYAGLFPLGHAARAATTNSWTNPVDGLWRTAVNWSSNQAPNSTFTFILITNANTKTVTIDAATPATNLTIMRLTVSAPSGFTNTLALVNLTTNMPLQISDPLRVNSGGVVTLTNSALSSLGAVIDRGGALNVTNCFLAQSGVLSTFDIMNGSVWLDSGLIDCSAIQAVRVGRTNNALGSLTVNGGTVLAPEVAIATSFLAPGALTVSGGIVNAANLVTVGYGVNSTGTLSITAGQLIATNDITYVGKSGF